MVKGVLGEKHTIKYKREKRKQRQKESKVDNQSLGILAAKWILSIVTVFVVLGSALACATIIWLFHTWPYLSMNELVYQLQTTAKGTNTDIIWQYIWECIPITVGIILAVIFILIFIRKMKKVYFIVVGGMLAAAFIALCSFAAYAYNRLDIRTYMSDRNTMSDFIDENYARPAETALTFPEQKRNLIYIYLESMEVTYSDKENGGAFRENYIPYLTKIAQENEDFSGTDNSLNGGYATTNATWTAAALFGETSGLPLTVPLEESDANTAGTMLPGVVTLGDILESQGYNQVFLIGSDGEFGGRKPYFHTAWKL